MTVHFQTKRRLWAPFLCLLILLVLSIQAVAGCRPVRIDESARVEKVIDGDTLRLVSGKKVRLIGINAPELDSEGAGAEPFAREARTFVAQFTKRANMLHLQYGEERLDRYG